MKRNTFSQIIKKRGIVPFLALSSLLFSSCQVEKYPSSSEEENTSSSIISSEDNVEAKDKLKKSFLNSLINGISLSIDTGYLNFGGLDNKAYFDNAELKAQLKTFSIQGLNISLDMPINYRGKKREAIMNGYTWI